ncbi:hypothetical protein IDH28_03505 [Pelagibacterales bacterium SAG-MED31]|nr:hypothetical protein [Pelagibacterales bacterium SAG-MED31]
MSLPIIYRIFGILNLLMGLVIFFGTPTMYATNGWGEFVGPVVVPVTTMAEHYGSHVFVLGIIALMIPSWMEDEQLKTATKTILFVQLVLTIVPVYHAAVSYIPFNGSFIAFTIVNIVFLGSFYLKSR